MIQVLNSIIYFKTIREYILFLLNSNMCCGCKKLRIVILYIMHIPVNTTATAPYTKIGIKGKFKLSIWNCIYTSLGMFSVSWHLSTAECCVKLLYIWTWLYRQLHIKLTLALYVIALSEVCDKNVFNHQFYKLGSACLWISHLEVIFLSFFCVKFFLYRG